MKRATTKKRKAPTSMGSRVARVAYVASPFGQVESIIGAMANPESGIKFVLGIAKKAGQRISEVQSVLFDRVKWTADTAKEWLHEHGFTSSGKDEGATFWRFRQQEPKKYKEFRTVVPGTNRNPADTYRSDAYRAGRAALRYGASQHGTVNLTPSITDKVEWGHAWGDFMRGWRDEQRVKENPTGNPTHTITGPHGTMVRIWEQSAAYGGGAPIYYSTFWINGGETITGLRASHSTLKGATRWANRVIQEHVRPIENPTPAESIEAYDEHLATTMDPAFQAASPAEQAAAMTVQDATENPMPLRSQLVHAVTEYDRKQEGKRGYNRYAIGHYLQAVDGVMEEVGKGYSVRSAITNNFTGPLADRLLRTVEEAPQTREEQIGPMMREERNPDPGYSGAAPDVKAEIESHPGTWFTHLAYPHRTRHTGGFDEIYAAAKEAAVSSNLPVYFGSYLTGREPARSTGSALAVWPDGHITWASQVPLKKGNPDPMGSGGPMDTRKLLLIDVKFRKSAEGLGRIIGVARSQGWTEVEEAAKAKARKLHIRTAALEKHAASVASQNPEDLGQAAFDAGKDFRLSGAYYETGVANARVAGYGFSKWYNHLTKDQLQSQKKTTLKKNWMEGWAAGKRVEKKQANPESAAAELYEEFHGQPPAETLEIVTEKIEHGWLTQLGTLVELKVQTVTNLDATFRFHKEAPELCSSEDGRQLYIEGGDQEIDLKALKMDGEKWVKDSMTIGVLYELTYRTKKGFHKFRTTDYFHKLGEESGVQPYLLYDPRNALLSISGGQYHTKPEGIVN